MNVKQDGHTTHRLVLIEYEHPLDKGNGYLLSHLAGYVEYLLYHEQAPPLHASRTLCTRLVITVLSDRTGALWTSASVCLPLGGAHSTTICALFSRSLTWIRKRSPQALSVIIWTSGFPIPAVFSSKRRSWPILI